MSKLISMAEAGKILEMSKARVHALASSGILTPIREGRAVKLRKEEVEALTKIPKGRRGARSISDSILWLKKELFRIEIMLDALCHQCKLSSLPQPISDKNLSAYYDDMVLISCTDSPAELEKYCNDWKRWGDIFVSVAEEELKRLKHLRQDPAPYIPFLKVCDKIIDYYHKKHLETEEQENKQKYRKISMLFRTLRNTLKEKAVNFVTIEGEDLAPIKKAEINVDILTDQVDRRLQDLPPEALKNFADIVSNNDTAAIRKLFSKLFPEYCDIDMTSPKVSILEASRILGTSPAAVGRWAKAGILTIYRKKHEKFFLRNEVILLRAIKDRGIKPLQIREEVKFLEYRYLKLSGWLGGILLNLGIPHFPRIFTDKELVEIYNKAKKYIGDDFQIDCRFDRNTWLEILSNLGFDEFSRLQNLTKDRAPFIPFIKLADKIVQADNYEDISSMRSKYLRFDSLESFRTVRKKLKEEAIMFLSESNPGLNPLVAVDLFLSGNYPSPFITASK